MEAVDLEEATEALRLLTAALMLLAAELATELAELMAAVTEEAVLVPLRTELEAELVLVLEAVATAMEEVGAPRVTSPVLEATVLSLSITKYGV